MRKTYGPEQAYGHAIRWQGVLSLLLLRGVQRMNDADVEAEEMEELVNFLARVSSFSPKINTQLKDTQKALEEALEERGDEIGDVPRAAVRRYIDALDTVCESAVVHQGSVIGLFSKLIDEKKTLSAMLEA